VQNEAKATSADHCLKCGQKTEPVYFNAGAGGLLVFNGEPPTGLIEKLVEAFTGSLACTESGMPLFAPVKERYYVPGVHCKHCRQITVRYSQ